MKSSIAFIAVTAAPLAAALQSSKSGGISVVNYCENDFPYQYVPAIQQGYVNAEISTGTLKGNGGKFDSPWISLSKGIAGGWVIKISPKEDDWSNIYQVEYTWHAEGDNLVWTDMSFVDGKEATLPKWKFDCPKRITCHNRGYQFPTDDTAMQVPVNPDESVTAILCPERAGNSAPSAPATYPPSTKAPEPTTPPPPPPAPSTTLRTHKSSKTEEAPISLPVKQANVVTPSPEPSAPSPAMAIETVIEYETVVMTAVVTETAVAYAKHKRHEHRHPHGHHL